MTVKLTMYLEGGEKYNFGTHKYGKLPGYDTGNKKNNCSFLIL